MHMIWRHAYRKIHICKNKASDLLKTNNNNNKNKNILHFFTWFPKFTMILLNGISHTQENSAKCWELIFTFFRAFVWGVREEGSGWWKPPKNNFLFVWLIDTRMTLLMRLGAQRYLHVKTFLHLWWWWWNIPESI